jgi:hypothetical protein
MIYQDPTTWPRDEKALAEGNRAMEAAAPAYQRGDDDEPDYLFSELVNGKWQPCNRDEHGMPITTPASEHARVQEGGAGSGYHGHPGRPGQRGGSGASDEISKAISGIRKHGGVTIDIHGNMPQHGFTVGGLGEEKIVDRLTRENVQEYHVNNATALAQPNRYFGGWIEKGQFYMDVSEVLGSRVDALAACHERLQIAAFNLDSGESVYAMSDESRPGKDNPATEIRESEGKKPEFPKLLLFGKDVNFDDIVNKVNAEIEKSKAS